jgi:SAM-dependent methyltransferase
VNTAQLRKYFKRDLAWGWGHQQAIVFEFLREAAEHAKGGVVLDAGAGHQRYRPFFEDSIYVAQEHPVAGRQNKNIAEYDILSDVKRIPLQEGCLDLVLSTSSLEHMEFPERFFTESLRVLRPGGALYVNVPFAYLEHEVPYDFQRPTRYGLRRYYESAGFENVEVRPTSSSLYTAQYFLMRAIKEDGKRRGRNPVATLVRKTLQLAAASVCKICMGLYDRGPFDDTRFPIGWVAKGYKPGTTGARPTYASKPDFIARKAWCATDTCLQDGRIVPKP